MEAKVVYTDPRDGSQEIQVGHHRLQCGGMNGDGYCYSHGSFDCFDNLTEEEKEALRNA